MRIPLVAAGAGLALIAITSSLSAQSIRADIGLHLPNADIHIVYGSGGSPPPWQESRVAVDCARCDRGYEHEREFRKAAREDERERQKELRDAEREYLKAVRESRRERLKAQQEEWREYQKDRREAERRKRSEGYPPS